MGDCKCTEIRTQLVMLNDYASIMAHQLQRIADSMSCPTAMVSQEDALRAWGLRIYETEFLEALGKLGVELL